jgi:hypothetical protein
MPRAQENGRAHKTNQFQRSTAGTMEDDPSCHSLRESHSLLLDEVEEGCRSDEGGVNVSQRPLDISNSVSSSPSLFSVRVWGDIFFPFLSPSLIYERKVGYYELSEE